MVATALAFSLLFAPRQAGVAEYTFKNIKAAYFAATRWDSVELLLPGVVKGSSPTPPSGAKRWIWVDEAKNRFVVGCEDDLAPAICEYLKEFDVAPKPVRLGVRLSRQDWGVETRSTIETTNNATVRVGSDEIGVSVSIKSRINNDGTITLFLGPEISESKKWNTVVRIKSGGRIVWRRGGVAMLGPNQPIAGAEPMPANPPLPSWLEIEVRADLP